MHTKIATRKEYEFIIVDGNGVNGALIYYKMSIMPIKAIVKNGREFFEYLFTVGNEVHDKIIESIDKYINNDPTLDENSIFSEYNIPTIILKTSKSLWLNLLVMMLEDSIDFECLDDYSEFDGIFVVLKKKITSGEAISKLEECEFNEFYALKCLHYNKKSKGSLMIDGMKIKTDIDLNGMDENEKAKLEKTLGRILDNIRSKLGNLAPKLLKGTILLKYNSSSTSLAEYVSHNDSIIIYDMNSLYNDEKEFTRTLIHEIGHGYEVKCMNNKKWEKAANILAMMKDKLMNMIHEGDVITVMTKKQIDDDTYSEHEYVEKDFTIKSIDYEMMTVMLDEYKKPILISRIKIVKINGRKFSYARIGLPSAYSIEDSREFIAETFCSWIYNEYTGRKKQMFDELYA